MAGAGAWGLTAAHLRQRESFWQPHHRKRGWVECFLCEQSHPGKLDRLGQYARADLLRHRLEGEAITIEYSDVEGGQAGIVTNRLGPVNWGEGNLDASPRFVHAGLGNYRLAGTSPAIGAGKADGAPAPTSKATRAPTRRGASQTWARMRILSACPGPQQT
jgi:hypothetical protein